MSERETYENMMRDSDMIFTQITSGDFPTYDMAEQCVLAFHVPDMSISRSGISHALRRLERHYAEVTSDD